MPGRALVGGGDPQQRRLGERAAEEIDADRQARGHGPDEPARLAGAALTAARGGGLRRRWVRNAVVNLCREPRGYRDRRESLLPQERPRVRGPAIDGRLVRRSKLRR